MTRILTGLILASGILVFPAAPVQAGPIERACIAAGRQSASGRLCDCIQNVADQTLTRSDQRMAAKFFQDPHKAQEIRQSDNTQHEAFWLRYKDFGISAAALCD
ncbi:MAG: hypothetical protein ACRBBS_11845 [Thalassovita sp.]